MLFMLNSKKYWGTNLFCIDQHKLKNKESAEKFLPMFHLFTINLAQVNPIPPKKKHQTVPHLNWEKMGNVSSRFLNVTQY